ncbi:hypothetical protein EJ05DRAFT_418972, partial [Pseudovirgaria hyperparasitica]
VIKALYDYKSTENDPSSGYLSFSQGDFLHVIGREDDPDWYEACNPLQQTRGLVPVKYFEDVGKQVRDSAGSTHSMPSQPSAGHDSGYAEGRSPANAIVQPPEQDGMRPMRMSKTMGKGAVPMLYGEVIYDFKAERPDELDAKAGEFIIVIAQSNPEWFVAKPITRLGGPGLIPVSFIQLKDMKGNILGDPAVAVQEAGIPRVEEWKRMAADYKNGSIPLGKLETNSAQSLQQGMDRMSIGNKSHRGPGSFSQQSQQPPRGSPLAPVRACVPEYGFSESEETFYFVVKCQMEENGAHMKLHRTYQNFYDLQINLIQEFPVEAGNVSGIERSLPYMPGPVTYVTENITQGRRPNLDEYIKNLLRLGTHITHSNLVRDFFVPRGRDGPDYEVDESTYRLSGASQQSDPSHPGSRQSSQGNIYRDQSQYSNSDYAYQANHQRAQSSMSNQQHYRNQSDLSVPPPMLRNNSALTQASASSASSAMQVARIKARFPGEFTTIIRMQPPFNLQMLRRELRQRRMVE